MTDKRDIPRPDPDREPLKVNVFRFVQNSVTTLAPMFPYLDEGSIVPCAATFHGAPGKRYGRFQHFNTVDEVLIMFGSEGGQRRPPGVVHVGAKLHTVRAPLDDPQDPGSVRVAVITQRQSIGKEQREEIRFICDECDRRLSIYEVDATPPKRGRQRETLGDNAPFKTLMESIEAARLFNENEELRRCKHCGHQNPPFPTEDWGWNAYGEQAAISKAGHDSIKAARGPGKPGTR